VAPDSFAKLISLACHDLRTPLATVTGFASTLQRLDEIEHPADRYVSMIAAAAEQMADLLDLLGAAARVEGGRFEPQLRVVDSRELAAAAADRLDEGRASVAGDGTHVQTDSEWATVSLSALAEAARRHGGLEQVTLTVDGATIAIAPIVDAAGPIAIGENLRDFPAAVAARVLRVTGVTVELDSEQLLVRFPPSSAGASTTAGP
jgi:signal transduction histidine kinase